MARRRCIVQSGASSYHRAAAARGLRSPTESSHLHHHHPASCRTFRRRVRVRRRLRRAPHHGSCVGAQPWSEGSSSHQSRDGWVSDTHRNRESVARNRRAEGIPRCHASSSRAASCMEIGSTASIASLTRSRVTHSASGRKRSRSLHRPASRLCLRSAGPTDVPATDDLRPCVFGERDKGTASQARVFAAVRLAARDPRPGR